MKKITTLIIVLFVGLSYGQTKSTKADKLFDRLWYKEAATLYEKELKKEKNYSPELLKRAGDSYFFNTDMENAHKWYDILVLNFPDDLEPEYLLRYANSLQGIGENRQAKRWMKEFAKRSTTEDNRASNFNQESKTIEDVLNIPDEYVLKNVKVNSKNSDFGVMYYKDQLVYSSAIDTSNFHTRIYHWNEQPFLNMFLGKLNFEDADVSKIKSFSEELNTRYHEATLAFSPDEKTVYFTRNNFNGDLKRDDDGTNHLKLYSAELIKNTTKRNNDSLPRWQNVKELPFNSENYSVGHPTLSEDGKLLYFVSDMPGSVGATDIFVVDVIKHKTDKTLDSLSYSKPRNLGTNVNTPGREMFPYITDNTIYFASDGHLGLGGLDVFQTTNKDGVFTKPTNLGPRLNSKMDDFNFIIKEDLDTGFVCSNREGGKGDDDIYSFVRTQVICEQSVRGYVSNTLTGERLANVELILFDEANTKLETTTSDLNGSYAFNSIVDCGTLFRVEALKTGYESKQKDFKTLNENGETIVPLGLETLNELIVEENGLLKIKIGIIYFDLDKSYIRKNDAAIELNKVVMLMREYPKMIIEIESHTDSRSSDSYNLALSDRRAKSTRDYIISQGIDASRIESAKGFGETQLINRCLNGVPCSESEHQLNRRSEFIILRM